ncbi:MAG: sigma-70 family RNA polymerase sigma factor [Actinobacteria bacterium]|nr:sigma-70 family RNA polymerase sigma factor [Actinomycetota bacterium]
MALFAISNTKDPSRGRGHERDGMTSDKLSEIAARAKQHDPGAFSELFDLFFERLRGYMYFKTGDLDMAEDLAAETLARGFENIDNFTDRGGTIGAWLFGIARNLMARERESKAKAELVELDKGALVADEELTDLEVLEKLDHAELYRAISTLPDEQQEVVLLRFMERYDVRTVAKIMGKKPGAVRALQFRAFNSLRETLSRWRL